MIAEKPHFYDVTDNGSKAYKTNIIENTINTLKKILAEILCIYMMSAYCSLCRFPSFFMLSIRGFTDNV